MVSSQNVTEPASEICVLSATIQQNITEPAGEFQASATRKDGMAERRVLEYGRRKNVKTSTQHLTVLTISIKLYP